MKKINFLLILFLIIIFITFYGCKKETKTSDIIVTIQDIDGTSIQDANITFDGKSGKSDSQGKYTFSKIEKGSYNLKITKEGFEDFEETIDISQGEKREVKVVLNKKSEFEEIKNYSEIESFHVIAEYRGKEGKNDQKIELITENFGKKEYMKVVNLYTGKLYAEIFTDEKTAKIRYGEKEDFYEMKREEVGSLSESFHSMINELVDGIKEEFNEKIKIPQGSLEYSLKRVGTEKINNYQTIKYEYSGEANYQNEKTKFLYEIWAINSGKYKNYPTKINAIMSFQDGSMISYTINIFELGEAKVPKI
ncbi:MAG: carboxypeptidase-like regulatory domain-containing protein [Caldisericia bacterium]|nr:carboxypeptidase-like regulatory domain-containing protein [Caldisericia bacterium]